MDEERINELKDRISLLRWDLSIMENSELKAQKELKLKLYEKELLALKNTAS